MSAEVEASQELQPLDRQALQVAAIQKAHRARGLFIQTLQSEISKMPPVEAKVETCPCGHQRTRHLGGIGTCLHKEFNGPYCRCQEYGKGWKVSNAEAISTVEDRRDNRDPRSSELTGFTKSELKKLRKRKAVEVNGK